MSIDIDLPIEFIANTEQFMQLCEKLQDTPRLALDTEFIRTNTFYSKVGLFQLADESTCYLVDPLQIEDWSGFKALLKDSSRDFIIHSCSEDLNLLFTFLGCVPATVFDTQIAAAFLGHGFSLSYQALVKKLLDVNVDKDETRSDWLKRPLSAKQIAYAAADVTYLNSIQQLLKQELIDSGRLQWFEAECSYQINIAAESEVEKNWENFYAVINNAWRLNELGLKHLQKLCYWREQTARSRNRPRNWIAKDDELMNIASSLSNSSEPGLSALSSIEYLNPKLVTRYGAQLIGCLQRDDDSMIAIDRKRLNAPLEGSLRHKLKACQQLVGDRAAEIGMAPELLGRKKQLLQLVRDFGQAGELLWSGDMSGWRRQILEPEVSRIMAQDT